MTLVTTARKAVPEIRAFARAFAIATGSVFVTRGKMGLADLFSRDPNIVIFTS
jgi:U3 small nucleolar ribonucleoprotein protein IMP4